MKSDHQEKTFCTVVVCSSGLAPLRCTKEEGLLGTRDTPSKEGVYLMFSDCVILEYWANALNP